VAYNFQTGNNKIKLLTEYEGVTQKVLFGNAVLAALMSAMSDVRAHPILRRLISSCGDTLTTLFTGPL
jgi:hypothetical protein